MPQRKSPRRPPATPAPRDIELDRFVDLHEAARLRGVSIDTLQRRSADKIIQISPRRVGMRIRHALLLGE